MQGFHAIIALRRQEPHWLLNDADAKRYGQALANALRHLPVKAAQKTIDFTVLAFIVFEMESPRIALSGLRSRQQKAQQAEPQPTVYPLQQEVAEAPPEGSPNGSGFGIQ